MDKVKIIAAISIGIVFIVSACATIFSTAKVANVVLRDYILEVTTCNYYYEPTPVCTDKVCATPEPKCEVDKNQSKRDIADGLSLMLIAAPIGLFLYRKLRKMV